VDAPRVSRKGRYSPYPTDSVRINPSRWSLPSSIVLVVFSDPKEGKPSVVARDRESEEGKYCDNCTNCVCNTDAAIDALYIAAVLSSHPGTPGAKILSKRKVVAAWQRDVVTRSRFPLQHPYLDIFTPEITPDVTDIRNVSADGI
jgi:hypothetical protein